MRRGVNLLQTCCSLGTKNMSRQTIYSRCLYPHHEFVKQLVHELLHGTLYRCIALTRNLYEEGYSGIDIVMFIHDYVIDQERMQEIAISRTQHLHIITQIGLTHVRLTEGVDSFCQICGMLSKIYRGQGESPPASVPVV